MGLVGKALRGSKGETEPVRPSMGREPEPVRKQDHELRGRRALPVLSSGTDAPRNHENAFYQYALVYLMIKQVMLTAEHLKNMGNA